MPKAAKLSPKSWLQNRTLTPVEASQTPGFSGGPWVLSFGHSSAADPIGHGDWINGNNSYYFTSGGPGGGNEYGAEIQSPYYDTSACNFWKGGSGWTGTC